MALVTNGNLIAGELERFGSKGTQVQLEEMNKFWGSNAQHVIRVSGTVLYT